jgi:membrane protein required for colicin V production
MGLAGDRKLRLVEHTRRPIRRRQPERLELADAIMPITLLDIILIGVMLVSALLAMIRGFMREVLSIAAWVIAALVTIYFYGRLLPYAKTYFNNDIVATAVVIGGTFLGTLLIVSVITVRFSDMVLDSRVGALDRTLGFLFGLARGLIIVVVAFLFFAWLVPDRSQPEWIRSAKSRVVLQGTGDWLMSMLPDDPESTILKRLKRPKPEEEEPTPGQRSSLDTLRPDGGRRSAAASVAGLSP